MSVFFIIFCLQHWSWRFLYPRCYTHHVVMNRVLPTAFPEKPRKWSKTPKTPGLPPLDLPDGENGFLGGSGRGGVFGGIFDKKRQEGVFLRGFWGCFWENLLNLRLPKKTPKIDVFFSNSHHLMRVFFRKFWKNAFFPPNMCHAIFRFFDIFENPYLTMCSEKRGRS
jgi:hypothetical protein